MCEEDKSHTAEFYMAEVGGRIFQAAHGVVVNGFI